MVDLANHDLRPLTCAECGHTAKVIRDCILDLGIQLNPVCDLERILADFEWVGSFVGDVFDTKFGPAVEDVRRAGEVAWRAHRMHRIGLAVRGSSNAKNADQKTRCLRKRIDRLADVQSKDLDILWELEVAGALGRLGCSIEFAETDIVIHQAGLPSFGIECKRPRTRKGLRAAVHDGCSQLDRRSMQGVVAISVDAVLHIRPDESKPVIYHVDCPEDFHSGIAAKIEDEIEPLQRELVNSLHDYCAGVVLCCTAVGWCKQPAAIIHTTSVRKLPNLGVKHGGDITSAIAELLK